jgi:hypothetical protein
LGWLAWGSSSKIGSFDNGIESCNSNGEWCCFLAGVVRLVEIFWVFGFLGVEGRFWGRWLKGVGWGLGAIGGGDFCAQTLSMHGLP